MFRLFALAFAAHFRSGKVLFLLTLAGVALGVASVVAIQILNRSALGAFEGSLQAVSGEADLSVLPRADVREEGVLPRVLGTPGVAAAWPLWRAEVALAGEAAARFLQIVGVELLAAAEGQAIRTIFNSAKNALDTHTAFLEWSHALNGSLCILDRCHAF